MLQAPLAQQQQQQLVHNIQAGGHQLLRVSSMSALHLAKPVGRDAVISAHLMEKDVDETNGAEAAGRVQLPSLSFMAPFVPDVYSARFTEGKRLEKRPAVASRQQCSADNKDGGAVGSEENGERVAIDGLVILRRWRRDVAPTFFKSKKAGETREDKAIPDSIVVSMEDYFNACRDVLKAAEDALMELVNAAELEARGVGNDAFPQQASPTIPYAAIVDGLMLSPTSESAQIASLSAQRLGTPSQGEALPGTGDNNNKGKAKKSSSSSVEKRWELVMENLTAGMVCPQVIDLKLGRMKTTPTGARAAEKEKKDEGTTGKAFGVRVSGIVTSCFDVSSPLLSLPLSDRLPQGWERQFVTGRPALQNVLKGFATRVEVARAPRPPPSLLLEDGQKAVDASSSSSSAENLSLQTIAFQTFLGGSHSPPPPPSSSAAEQEQQHDDGVLSSDVFALHSLTVLKPLLGAILKELSPIIDLVARDESLFKQYLDAHYSIISSSVLILYDGNDDWTAADEEGDTDERGGGGESGAVSLSGRSVVVRLIDFDRSGPRAEHHSEATIQYGPALLTVAELFEEALRTAQL